MFFKHSIRWQSGNKGFYWFKTRSVALAYKKYQQRKRSCGLVNIKAFMVSSRSFSSKTRIIILIKVFGQLDAYESSEKSSDYVSSERNFNDTKVFLFTEKVEKHFELTLRKFILWDEALVPFHSINHAFLSLKPQFIFITLKWKQPGNFDLLMNFCAHLRLLTVNSINQVRTWRKEPFKAALLFSLLNDFCVWHAKPKKELKRNVKKFKICKTTVSFISSRASPSGSRDKRIPFSAALI